jgi:hypothetical protein
MIGVGVLFVVALGLGGFVLAKQTGLLGEKASPGASSEMPVAVPEDAGGDTSESVETTASAEVETDAEAEVATTTPLPAPVAVMSPPGTVLNLKDKPSDPARAALRQSLLDAARRRLKTRSRFFVNQLWVDGEWAIGEIGAEKRGHRIWVVWRGSPPRVVFVRDWGVTDEQVLRAKVGELPPELLARIDWTRRWPKEFKFVR